MSWDAGALTSTLGLDIGEYAGSILQAEGITHALGSTFTEFLTNPLLGVIEIFKMAGEAAEAVFEKIGEFASHALKTSADAMKAGVGTEFFSGLTEAGKRVDVASQAIGDGLKFMNRNAVEALQGSTEAQHGFTSLGISMEFLKSHLNDSEGMFAAVREGMEQLPTSAEKTRAAMEVMGRGGSELIPLLSMTSDELEKVTGTAHGFGALVDSGDISGAKAWREASVEISEMEEGLTKIIARPVLDVLAQHGDDLKAVLLNVTAIVAEILPEALAKVAEGFEFLTIIARTLWDVLLPIAELTDKIGLTTGSANFNRQAANFATAEGDAAGEFAAGARHIGEEIARGAKEELAKSQLHQPAQRVDVHVNVDGRGLGAAASLHNKVSKAVGGKGPSHYHSGF